MSVALGSSAAVLYSQPHNGTGTINLSSWVFENGSDADMYAYDSFIIPTGGAVERVTWRGGYQYNAMYGSVNNFSIYFYESTAGGTEPDVNNPQLPEFYLARYLLNGIAGETPAGTFGGKAMYDYAYDLPTPFNADAGVKYWIRIEGFQPVYPDWGLASGSGGNGNHFAFSTGAAMFNFYPNDLAFTLEGTPVPEPAAALVVAAGIGALAAGGMVRRRLASRSF